MAAEFDTSALPDWVAESPKLLEEAKEYAAMGEHLKFQEMTLGWIRTNCVTTRKSCAWTVPAFRTVRFYISNGDDPNGCLGPQMVGLKDRTTPKLVLTETWMPTGGAFLKVPEGGADEVKYKTIDLGDDWLMGEEEQKPGQFLYLRGLSPNPDSTWSSCNMQVGNNQICGYSIINGVAYVLE